MTQLEALKLPREEIQAFCKRWKVQNFSIFGSALRPDFEPDSDIDILVEFAPEAEWSLFDHVEMKWELQAILGRDVDLVTRSALEQSRNWIRKADIVSTAQTLDLD